MIVHNQYILLTQIITANSTIDMTPVEKLLTAIPHFSPQLIFPSLSAHFLYIEAQTFRTIKEYHGHFHVKRLTYVTLPCPILCPSPRKFNIQYSILNILVPTKDYIIRMCHYYRLMPK